jgi:hypothetical protein
MSVCLWVSAGLVVWVKGEQLVNKWRSRRAVREPLRRVFGAIELQELDEHLDQIAELEQHRLDATVAHYVAGMAGHVVAVWDSPEGIALGLSDGWRLVFGAVSRPKVDALRLRASETKLYPAHVERHASSYRLLLRGEAGADIELSTRRLALAH